jgi:predicted tellurium resistance membrane protein TerC
MRSLSPSGVVRTATGVAAAFGLSAIGALVGITLAIELNRLDKIGDALLPVVAVVVAAAGTVAAGATVADVAGKNASLSIAVAGLMVFLAADEILRGVESTGADRTEGPVAVLIAVAFTALLAAGARLGRRHRASSVSGR